MNTLTTLALSWQHILVLLIICVPYFIPTIIAFNRKKPNAGAIFALNFLLGWSFIGWIVALIWSLSTTETPQHIIVNQSNPQNSQSNLDQLFKLKELHEKAAITDEEFQTEKNKLLS